MAHSIISQNLILNHPVCYNTINLPVTVAVLSQVRQIRGSDDFVSEVIYFSAILRSNTGDHK